MLYVVILLLSTWSIVTFTFSIAFVAYLPVHHQPRLSPKLAHSVRVQLTALILCGPSYPHANHGTAFSLYQIYSSASLNALATSILL